MRQEHLINHHGHPKCSFMKEDKKCSIENMMKTLKILQLNSSKNKEWTKEIQCISSRVEIFKTRNL